MSTTARSSCVDALRTLVSVDTDGASASVSAELRAARRHVERCPICAGLLDDEGTAERALHAVATHRPSRSPRLRVVLFVLAVCQLALAMPWLFGLNPIGALAGHVTSSHLTRDGAIGVIIGVSGIGSALHPRHAVALLFTAIAAIVMQAFGFAVDESANRTSALYEVLHLLVPIIITCIGLLALRRDPSIGGPTRPPRLRAVR